MLALTLGRIIVLDKEKAAAATEEILSQYQVPATVSEALRKEEP